MPGTYTSLLYHLVFSTKDRIPLIEAGFREELYSYLGGIIRGEGGVLMEIGGMSDHLHLLVRLKPSIALADLLRCTKANSSKWVNEEKRRMRKFGWQDGYAAFTVSKSQVSRVTRYIANQQTHHAKTDFKQELRGLLDKPGVE